MDIRPGQAEQDEMPLSPAEALALVRRQEATSRRQLVVSSAFIYAVWGVAWLVAFGLTFLAYGGDDPPVLAVPEWLIGLVWPVAMGGALLVMGVHIARRSRGIAGASSTEGAFHGLGWLIAFAGSVPVALALRPDSPDELAYYLFPSIVICIVVGTAYMFGAIGWQDPVQFVIGAWILAVNAVGVLVGLEWYTLVLSVAGGGGFLAAAAAAALRNRSHQ